MAVELEEETHTGIYHGRVQHTVRPESPHVIEMELQRPDKLNATDPGMFEGLAAAANAVSDDADARAVILSGAGRGFCAGMDLSTFSGAFSPESGGLEALRAQVSARTHGDSNIWQYAAMAWHHCPVPVIAALHGVCFGAGFQIALGADIRIAHPDTRFAIMEAKWGLVPDMGGTVLMTNLAPADVIARLTYTAEEFTAEDALRWGFITEIHDAPMDRARGLAHQIAGRSPSAVRAAKQLLKGAAQRPASEQLELESALQNQMIASAHQVEAVMAGMEGREPDFAPLGQT